MNQSFFYCAACVLQQICNVHFTSTAAVFNLHLMHEFTVKNQTIYMQLQSCHSKTTTICDGVDTSHRVFVRSAQLRSEGHLISGITPLQLEVVTLCAHCHGPKGTKATVAHRRTVVHSKKRNKRWKNRIACASDSGSFLALAKWNAIRMTGRGETWSLISFITSICFSRKGFKWNWALRNVKFYRAALWYECAGENVGRRCYREMVIFI